MPGNDDKTVELLAAVGRMERTQERFVAAADSILSALEVHNEKLDAILMAATKEPGPSPTADLLKQIVVSLTEQSAVLNALPAALAQSIREELERDLEEEIAAEDSAAWEPADPTDVPQ